MNAQHAVLTEKPAALISAQSRISSVDLLRGIVMVIMALDHTRDFLHLGAMGYNPTDMATTNPALFFTRWITHFCAPTFVFLAGTSIYMSAQRKSKKELTIFLVTRGLWLILLELVVVRFCLLFNFYYDVIPLQVIWAIGASMVCMALLHHFSYRVTLIIGMALIFGHNLTDAVPLKPGETFFETWAILRQTGFFPISSTHNLLVFYPLLPWLGIMILGYCLGKLYTNHFNPLKRQQILFFLGLSAVGLFIALRLINIYGDPSPWTSQKNALFTVMSFLNTTKYPVSLLYTLMTIGPVLILLAWMETTNTNLLKPLIVFGRVPLFYYIFHFLLIHSGGLLLFMNKTGRSFSEIDFHFNRSFGGITPEAGYSLFWVYVAWIAVVVLLYPVCKWYDHYKATHRHWWLSYM